MKDIVSRVVDRYLGMSPPERVVFRFVRQANAPEIVASHFIVADQPSGQRNKDKQRTNPINKPKGISRDVQKEQGKTEDDSHDETVSANRKDITPKDVFAPLPNATGMKNLAETGKDLSKAIEKDIPKDKGYDAVRNLSQYLIKTDGGGSGSAAGRR